MPHSSLSSNTADNAEMMREVKDSAPELDERVRLLLDAAPICCQLFDKDLKVIYCNEECIRLFGVSDKQEFCDKFYSLSPEYQPCGGLSREMQAERIQGAVEDGYSRFEWTHRELCGDLIPAEVTLIRVKHNDDYAVAAFVRNLTEQRAREAEFNDVHALSESQLLKMNLMVKATKIGLWDMTVTGNSPIDPDNPVIWSKEARNMIGIETETDYHGILSDWSECLHPDDREGAFNDFAKHLLDKTGNTPYDTQCRMRKANGEYGYFRATGEAVRDEEGNAIRVAGALMDITETKKLLLDLDAEKEAAQNANRAKSSFLTNISHEIRTPMNSIIGFSELALDNEMTPETRDYLNLIIENSQWLLQLINDLLDISKIESGNMKMERIPFDLHEMFLVCKTMIMPKAMEKNLDLFFYAEPVIGKMLIGDPTRLRQVIINLLSNAVKFTEAGTVKLAAVIVDEGDVEDSTSGSRCLRFEVKDTGIGMTAEQIEKILEPFIQADASTTRKYGGTGLGLSITKNIVELMGGELNIESEPSLGTKISFEINFDVTDSSDEAAKPQMVFTDAEKPVFEGEILICEDNKMNQRVVAEHLTRVGLNIELAENGLDGVERVHRKIKEGAKPFDLILMDIYMPVMDGVEAASQIIELGVRTPIVAMTANIIKEDKEQYTKSGMSDYIAKPFTSQELWNLLLKYLKPIGFSKDKVVQRRRADEVLQDRLKSDFVKDKQSTWEDINRALNAGDIKLAHRLLHSLKNSAALIGRTALQKAAADVEILLKTGEVLPTEAQMNLLRDELSSALAELEPCLIHTINAAQSESAAELDADEIREIYINLEPLLERGNLKSMQYIERLRLIPGHETLVGLIESFQFKAAANMLSAKKESSVLEKGRESG